MPGYRSEIVTFEAPPDWEDKTIVAFSAPGKPGQFSPNVVMTKDTLKPGETLRSYADKQIMELARRLEGFDLVESGEREVNGLQALEYRFSWRSEHAELHQHSVMLVAAGQVLSFTGTTAKSDSAVLEQGMEHVLSTLQLPGGVGYTPTGSTGGPPPAAPSGSGGWVPRG